MRISLIALVVNLVGNFALVPVFGYMGAAVMTLLTEAVVFVLASRLVLGRLDLRFPGFGRVGRTAVAATILGLMLGAMRLAGAPLAALVAVACISYPALLLGLGGLSLDDVRLVLRRAEAV
jgi:O-antigen/teichoic acid export membrane protein